MLLVKPEFKRSDNTLFYSIFKHQKMPKLTEHCSKVQYEHSDVLVVFTVPPVAFWQVLAMLYIHLQIRSSSFLFHLFRTQQKMSAAFGIWKLRRFILEMIFQNMPFCVCFSLFTGSSGYAMWLCTADGAQGSAGRYQECNYKTRICPPG